MVKLINNRKKNRLDKLLEAEDPVFDKDYRKFLGMKPCPFAKKIIENIEKNIGFCSYGLVNDHNLHPNSNKTVDSALMAVAYIGLEMEDRAREIVAAVEEHMFPKKGGDLFFNGLVDFDIEADANLAMALAYQGLGMDEKADNIIKAVEESIQYRRIDKKRKLSLLGHDPDSNIVRSEDNALYAIVKQIQGDYSMARHMMFNLRDTLTEKDRNAILAQFGTDNKRYLVESNALCAVACMLGNDPDWRRYMTGIIGKIGKPKEPRINEPEYNIYLTGTNAAMAIYYMCAKGFTDKIKKNGTNKKKQKK